MSGESEPNHQKLTCAVPDHGVPKKIEYRIHHAHVCRVGRMPSSNRTARLLTRPLVVTLLGNLPFRRIVF